MKGRGFAGLARYLETGRTGNDPDRVDWIEARNLPTTDPETASLLMRATAARSDRTEKPVYHIALSFDPKDAVDRATMVRVVDRLLSDLGLQQHQVLIVAHGDTNHPHLHLMINRVHPETFRAWDPKHDFARVERSLREQERQLALRAVPGHHYRLDGQARPDRSEALTTGQLRRWERTGEVPMDELMRRAARQHLVFATSLSDLETRLDRAGLRIEPRGSGLVVTDGLESVKVSSVTPGVSRPALEEAFGESYGEDRSQSERQPAEGAARAIEGDRAAVALGRNAGTAVEPPGETPEKRRDDLARPGRDSRSHHLEVSAKSDGGTGAERAPGHRSDQARDRAAARAGRDGEESGLQRRATPTADRQGRTNADGRDLVGADGRDARRDGGGVGDPRLDAVRRSIGELERRMELEKARDRAGDDLDRARTRLAPIEAQPAEARAASRRFNAALAEVYRDPAAVRREFHARARRDGVAAISAEMARNPERFGELRGTRIGPIRSDERNAALRNAAKLEHLGGQHFHKVAEAWRRRDHYREARAGVTGAEHRVASLDGELRRDLGRVQVEQRLRRAVRALRPEQRQALQRSLPLPQRQMVTAALAAAQAFGREQGHER